MRKGILLKMNKTLVLNNTHLHSAARHKSIMADPITNQLKYMFMTFQIIRIRLILLIKDLCKIQIWIYSKLNNLQMTKSSVFISIKAAN